jgi:aryl-alcohol dehydrogenase-like predicted oxidoreductase
MPVDTVRLSPAIPVILPLGLGTWQWGDRLVWGYGRHYHDADLQATFRAALDCGITLFDTAEIYGWGRSERLLGQFNRDWGRPAVIATKFMPSSWRLDRGALRRALQGSLRRLNSDRVELYQVHWPLPPRSIETWADALADVVHEGLVGAVGVSNFDARQVERVARTLAARGHPLATNQVEYSLLQRRIERNGVLETCRRLGVTVIAHSPLGMGLLGGRYSAAHRPGGWRGQRYQRLGPPRVDALVSLLREIGAAHDGAAPAQVALNWLICQGVVPIPGARSAEQARQNAGALGWRLTADELARLDQASVTFV